MGTSCAVADVQGGKATIWSPTQSAYPTRSGVAMLLGLQPDERARDLHARRRLLRHQRRRHRVVRRRAAVAGRRASRCACSSRARTRWRGRTTASRTSIDQRAGVDADGTHRRVGLRGVVADARRPARLRHAGQRRSPACSPGFEPAPFTPRRPPSRPASSATTATPRRRTSPAASRGKRRRRRHDRERARADAHGRARRSSPDRCARRRACRTRSRTSRSWTRSPRT